MAKRYNFKFDITTLVTFVFICIALFIILKDWQRYWPIIRSANYMYVAMALTATALSYLSISAGFAIFTKLYTKEASYGQLLSIGFVSSVLNHVVSTIGGIPGYAFRLSYAKRRGISREALITGSLMHSYLNNIVLFALLPYGFYVMLTHRAFSHTQTAEAFALIAVLALFLGATFLLLFSNKVRTMVFERLGQFVTTLTKKDLGISLQNFDKKIAQQMEYIKRNLFSSSEALCFALLDWFLSVLALQFCFFALGYTMPLSLVFASFSVGVIVGFISPAPGGLGVQEGVIAVTLTMVGVPFEHAFLAAVLFRIVYYLIPFLISLIFYPHLLKKTT